jgi:hypothetical protein
MEVDFEHRSPKPDDAIKIGMVDLKDNDHWVKLGQTMERPAGRTLCVPYPGC